MSDLDQRLQDLWSHMAHPAAIVTATSRNHRAGCLVGLHVQCSIEPLRALVCLSKVNRTHEVAAHAVRLAVHYPLESKMAIAELFGSRSGHDVDKFADVAWTAHQGVVTLDDIRHRWIGHIVQRTDLGDHTGFVLEPVDFADHADTSTRFIDMRDLSWLEAGHERNVM